MAKSVDVGDTLDNLFHRDMDIKLDITRCYDILSHQIYGKNWNFISKQFKRNNERVEKSKQYLNKTKEKHDLMFDKSSSDKLSLLDEIQLSDHIFGLFDIENAKVIEQVSFDCGYSMNGNDFTYQREVLIENQLTYGEKALKCLMIMTVNADTGEILSFDSECKDLDVEVCYKKANAFIGKSYSSLIANETDKDVYYVVAQQRVGDDVEQQLIETIYAYEDDALLVADELLEISPNLSLQDKYTLSRSFAWDILKDKPAVTVVGKKDKILVPVR